MLVGSVINSDSHDHIRFRGESPEFDWIGAHRILYPLSVSAGVLGVGTPPQAMLPSGDGQGPAPA